MMPRLERAGEGQSKCRISLAGRSLRATSRAAKLATRIKPAALHSFVNRCDWIFATALSELARRGGGRRALST
jgi:lambda repressor-like predicted transcriptional regulator